MKSYVLDTTVASLLLDKSPLLAFYGQHLQDAQHVISFQTVAEMRLGALKAKWGRKRRRDLEKFFRQIGVVEYNDHLASAWAQIMYDSMKAGRRLEAGDGWVAATARYLKVPLLTHDRHFSVGACPSITVFRHLPD